MIAKSTIVLALLAAPWCATAEPPPRAPVNSMLKAVPEPPSALGAARGGSAGIDTRLAATVSGNSASQVATGANVIQSGAFAHAVGVPVVIQNSGANVLIQSSTVIHLKLQ